MIVHADNFSIYGTNTGLMLNGIYAQTGSFSLGTDPDGVSGGRVMNIFNNSTNGSWTVLRYALAAGATTKVGVAFRVWLASLPTSNTVAPRIAVFRTTGNSDLAVLEVLSNGALSVILTSGATYTTPTPVVAATGHYHIEMVYDTAGTSLVDFEVRVEGIPVLTQTGVAGSDSAVGQMAVVGVNNGAIISPRWYMKDLVYYDGAGTYNTTFLGSVLVTNLVTTSDIALNWTPSVGTTGFNILDNIPPTTDNIAAPYSAIAPNYPDPYVATLSDLPIEVTSVKGLVTFVRAAKTDGGDGSMQVGLISDAGGTPTTVLGADRPITIAQSYWRDVFEVDPDTGAPWLPDAVNNVQIQLDRTT